MLKHKQVLHIPTHDGLLNDLRPNDSCSTLPLKASYKFYLAYFFVPLKSNVFILTHGVSFHFRLSGIDLNIKLS